MVQYFPISRWIKHIHRFIHYFHTVEVGSPPSDPIFKPFFPILSLIVIVSRLYWLLKLNFEIATEFSRGRVIIAGSSSAPFARFLHPPCVACVKLIDDIVLHCPRHYHPHIPPSSTFHPR